MEKRLPGIEAKMDKLNDISTQVMKNRERLIRLKTNQKKQRIGRAGRIVGKSSSELG